MGRWWPVRFMRLLGRTRLLSFNRGFGVTHPRLSNSHLFPSRGARGVATGCLTVSSDTCLPAVTAIRTLSTRTRVNSHPATDVMAIRGLLVGHGVGLSRHIHLLHGRNMDAGGRVLSCVFNSVTHLTRNMGAHARITGRRLLTANGVAVGRGRIGAAVSFNIPASRAGGAFS